MAVETPKYELLKCYPDFEVRQYAPYVVAETEVEGERTEVGSEAFSRLAGYIFGKNLGARKLAMTAPVTQEPAAGTTVAMTAPHRWKVQFTMPSGLTLETLPEPTDPRVHLRKVEPRRVAVVRYSGTWSERNYQEHFSQLEAALKREGLSGKGDPVWARYDPPFKPWFLRTNEILVEVN